MSNRKPHLRLVKLEPGPAASTEVDWSSDAGLAGFAVGAVTIVAMLALEAGVLFVLFFV